MSTPTPDPLMEEWRKLVDRYEAIRLTGDPEVAHLADDIAWFMEDQMGQSRIVHTETGILYSVDAVGELVRDPKYKAPRRYRRAG